MMINDDLEGFCHTSDFHSNGDINIPCCIMVEHEELGMMKSGQQDISLHILHLNIVLITITMTVNVILDQLVRAVL